VLTATGYVLQYFFPVDAHWRWIVISIAGCGGSVLLRLRRGRPRHDNRIGRTLSYAQFILLFYGFIFVLLLWPLDGRQLAAFWPTLFMLGTILMGLWLGRFFIVCGVLVTLLTIIGFYWSGPWFPLWMAAVNGGGLIASGLWLRRMG
jgi:hypothetical protein